MLDLRLPVGIFFLLVGIVLAVYGTIHPQMTQGINFNVEQGYGFFLIVFGGVMTFFGWKAEKVILAEEAKEPNS